MNSEVMQRPGSWPHSAEQIRPRRHFSARETPAHELGVERRTKFVKTLRMVAVVAAAPATVAVHAGEASADSPTCASPGHLCAWSGIGCVTESSGMFGQWFWARATCQVLVGSWTEGSRTTFRPFATRLRALACRWSGITATEPRSKAFRREPASTSPRPDGWRTKRARMRGTRVGARCD